MSVADILRQRIIKRLQRFEASREPRHEIIWGLLGDVDGTVSVPNQAGKVYCRLLGIDSNLVRAWNSTMPLVANARVDVEVERQEGMPDDYAILGVSKTGYVGYENAPRFYLPPHHETHEYSSGTGGYDIVNVYNRMLAELRADAQATPDMTLTISAGLYMTKDGMIIRDAANSPAFGAAPAAGLVRFDLLYLDVADNQYKISAGTAAPVGVAARPLPGSKHIAIVWAFLQNGDTAITNSMLIDARVLYLPLGSLKLDLAQVGTPTYEDVQDWVNTTQSAGLISGGAIAATSYAITDADDVAETFKVAGDMTAYFTDGAVFTVSGSTGNDGDYTTVGNATYAAGETTITVADVPDGTDDGDIADGRVDVALGAGMVKKTDDQIDGITAFFDWPATANILLVDNDVNWLYIKYDGGPNSSVNATNDATTIDHTTEFAISRVYREGTVLHILQAGQYIYDPTFRAQNRICTLRAIERATGAIISDEGTLKIKVTAAVLFCGWNKITTTEVDTSGAGRFRAWYHDGGGNWTSTGHPADQTDIDSAQYDTGTGLAALAANRYGVYWVFLDYDSHIHVVYGTTSYKLHEAEAAALPAVPPICSEFSVLVARVIAYKDAAEITEVQSAFVTTFLIATPANYQDLANRGHDLIGVDHQDTLADTVIDGDVIIGNATPKWSRLAIAVPAANVRNVLGIDNGETRPSWKTALDAVNPANIAGAVGAAPGTSLIFSHRDHVHAHPAGLGVNLHHTQAHDIVGGDHMVTGAAWNVVGCAAVDAIGLLLARDDVTAPVESILKSTAAGGLTLVDLTLANDLLLADGAVVGITGNERLQFNAAGTIQVLGANLELPGGALLQWVDAAVSVGAVYGHDSGPGTSTVILAAGTSQQSLFRTYALHAATQGVYIDARTSTNTVKIWNNAVGNNVNLDIQGGLNVGTATGAGVGDVFLSGRISWLRTPYVDDITISGGVITVGARSSYRVINQNNDATDDLDTISGGSPGQILILQARYSGKTTTLKDDTGNLNLAGDFALNNVRDRIMLYAHWTDWMELCRSNNA